MPLPVCSASSDGARAQSALVMRRTCDSRVRSQPPSLSSGTSSTRQAASRVDLQTSLPSSSASHNSFVSTGRSSCASTVADPNESIDRQIDPGLHFDYRLDTRALTCDRLITASSTSALSCAVVRPSPSSRTTSDHGQPFRPSRSSWLPLLLLSAHLLLVLHSTSVT
jgi:hypothetical protein